MNYILAEILQTATVIAAFGTLLWRIQSRIADRHSRALEEIKKSLNQELNSLELRIAQVEEIRQREDKALHERINNLESGTYKEINTRLAHMEGELTGLRNLTRLMEKWLIENGAKVE